MMHHVHKFADHFGRYPINVVAILIVVLVYILAILMFIFGGGQDGR